MAITAQIDLWTPDWAVPDIVVEAGLTPIPITPGDSGGITVDEFTAAGGIVISARAKRQKSYVCNPGVSIGTASDIDYLRILQDGGSQIQARSYEYVDISEATINNRVAYGTAITIGNRSRSQFEFPCLLEFPENWAQWIGFNASDGETYEALQFRVLEIV